MPTIKKLSIGLFLVVVVFGVALFWNSKNIKRIPTSNTNDHTSAANPEAGGFIPNIVTDDKGVLTGRLLYTKDGDLWVGTANGGFSMKLIDGDTIVRGEYAPDLSQVAYTKAVQSQIVLNTDENPRSEKIDRLELYVASSIGDRSIRVAEAVSAWGWISNTSLLWYESSKPREIFGWGYWGTGDVFVVDSLGGPPNKIIDESGMWSVMRPSWNSSGKRVAYIRAREDEPYTLVVTDRGTKRTLPLLKLPYLGGDRGGPAPIPHVFWSPGGNILYTGFTTLGYYPEGSYAELKNKYELGRLVIFEINTTTGKSKQLVSVPSCGMNEEQYPPIMFSSDFSLAIYPRIRDGVDVSHFTQAQYWSCDATGLESYVVEDLRSHKVVTLLEDIIHPSLLRSFSSRPQVFDEKKPVYLIQSKDSSLRLSTIHLNQPNTKEELFLGAMKNNAQGYSPAIIHDLLWVPEAEALFFRAGDPAADSLFRVGLHKTDTASYLNLYKVLDGVSDYRYYKQNL